MYNPNEECKIMIDTLKNLCEQKGMKPHRFFNVSIIILHSSFGLYILILLQLIFTNFYILQIFIILQILIGAV